MVVREAKIEDVSQLVELGREFVDATILASIGYDDASVAGTIASLIEQPGRGAVFVLELEGGRIVGAIGGVIVPLYFNLTKSAAQQFFWYVSPRHRGAHGVRLLGAFEEWAQQSGASVLFSGAKSDAGFPGMEKLLTRRGFVSLESVFLKEVGDACSRIFDRRRCN